jgi:perosamine synthetase
VAIPLTDVRLSIEAKAAAASVLNSGKLSSGPWVKKLEQVVGGYSRTTYAVAVSNATAALYLALVGAGVEDGDKVIVPAFTFAGTVNAVKMAGAVPVFADIGDDWLIDPEHVRALQDSQTVAVMPVHLFGAMVDIKTMPKGLLIVEDAAQAIGAQISYGAVSLYGSKTIGCGEGGVIVGSETAPMSWAAVARNQGMTGQYEHVMAGFNFRMTDLQASVAVGQLSHLGEVLRARKRNADILWESLHDLPIKLPNPVNHLWHLFTIGTPNRDGVRDRLAELGVESRVYYPQALPDIGWMPDADTPKARQAAREVLSIPVHEHLTGDEIAKVAEATRQAVLECVSV